MRDEKGADDEVYGMSREQALKIEAVQRAYALARIRRIRENHRLIESLEAEGPSEEGRMVQDRVQMMETLDEIKKASPEDFDA
jgi:hypothetical protein